MAHRAGAALYVLWGLLHFVAALRIYQSGAIEGPGLVQGRLYQSAWNLLYLSLLVIVVAILFNWRNSLLGYWLNLATIGVTDIGFIVLLYLPGYSSDVLGPILWILGAILSTLGILTAPRTR